MLVSQKLAVAAHMHVLLRRKTGRVTDTEWMSENLEYALEIVRFARAKALEDGHADLAEWAGKLEQAVLEDPAVPRKPLAQTAMQLLRERAGPATLPPPDAHTSGFGSSDMGTAHIAGGSTEVERARHSDRAKPKDPRYVGGLR